ncbi:MAG: ABC transporter ATP-binding protein [Dethiobacter sp.]|jgi:peptide/nickel transport system ATP-binding protein|nr:ABC transporter ATP-binding protein [Dethiobacter sp.]
MSLLEVKELSASFYTKEGRVKAVEQVSFCLEKGEMLGLIGESGCGKSTLGLSLLRLIEKPGRIDAGNIMIDGVDIVQLKQEAMRKVRWKTISMIPQSAMSALNPTAPIGKQILEAIELHMPEIKKQQAIKKVKELLEWVGIDGDRWLHYPHEFSGGMKQRVAIAMALACDPKVVISDEATTGLDVLTQAQVIHLIKRLQAELGLSILVISHDLAMVTAICERIAVMYAGHLVEIGPTQKILCNPLHPYTRGLLSSNISLDSDGARTSIPGSVPRLINPPPGCHFHPRCSQGKDICKVSIPRLRPVKDNEHQVACFFYEEGF